MSALKSVAPPPSVMLSARQFSEVRAALGTSLTLSFAMRHLVEHLLREGQGAEEQAYLEAIMACLQKLATSVSPSIDELAAMKVATEAGQ
jgi:hypothetical protein